MKKIINKISFGLVLLTILLIGGCETTDLEVVDSPNALSPTQADVDLFLNAIQQGAAVFFNGVEGSGFQGMSEFGMQPVRMLHGFGPSYQEFESPTSLNEVWSNAYSFTLADIRGMIPLAEANGQFTHIGIAQVIEAYIMMTLADFFGDVPYSEAIRGGEDILNPVLDSSISIYEAVDQLLINAIANFNEQELLAVATDLYFGGDESKWIKLANTLRLKLYLQTRLANEAGFNSGQSTSVINSLVAGGDLILDSQDDWQYQWGTNISAPDSRHPFFEKNYDGSPSSNFYFTVYYMDLLANQYSLPDPRTRYYFYRQESDYSNANVVTKDCVTQNKPAWYGPNDPFCIVPNLNGMNGFWGRNHGDPDGIPPDQQFRTVFGVYPAGGEFDDNSFNSINVASAPSLGLMGAGISPLILSSFTNFMLAESALTLGTTGDARTYLETGIRQSISKVMTFGASVADGSSFIPTSDDIEDYITDVLADYDGGDDTQKLKVIVEQYFIALWGNGVEAFNTYRRTGQPSDVTPAVELQDPGVFIRSYWYPSNTVDRNSSVNQKSGVSTPVFWDTNPEGFVK